MRTAAAPVGGVSGGVNFFIRLERMVEEAVEGLFRRGGGHLQPVEIARRLTRAMEDHRRVSVARVYAPNAFRIAVAPAEYEALRPFLATLERELKSYLSSVATRQGWSFVGPLSLEFAGLEGLAPVEVRVEAAFAEGEAADDGALAGATRVFSIDEGSPQLRLAVTAGPDAGREVAVCDGGCIGRQEQSELRLSDPKVSRRHARVERGPEGWVIIDLQSTNGTLVNGERIERRPLAVGDTVELGATRLEVRDAP
ncbi:MAG TPA: DUF3662 and FHA domain-containing protein [Limnochordia bacterium]